VQNKLAIVIPAFKSCFFSKTLDSISSQSCKDFTLYIGDDNSGDDIFSIVSDYQKKINIVYHRFDENLGGNNLTKQWDRCVNLSVEEPYILLFSDDDELSENAVSSFYREIEDSDVYDLYRFDLNIINEKGEKLMEFTFPELQDKKDFFYRRINESQYSCITQYIFKRSAFVSGNGFVSFPMAWFSDDASLLRFTNEHEIKKINGALVKWRFADDINITSSKRFEKQKSRAAFEYAIWFNSNLKSFFNKDEINNLTQIYLAKRMLKMPLKELFRFFSILTVFSLSGFSRGLYLYLYDLYCRVAMITKASDK
jgi:glycosyltransferase involved in cell wall biosynthesis